jgi:acetyl-CoA synthetase
MDNAIKDICEQAGIESSLADRIVSEIDGLNNSDITNRDKWRTVSKKILKPWLPFELHQFLFNYIYKGETNPPPYACWVPSVKEINQTNLACLQKELGYHNYSELHKWSVTNREEFTQKMIDTIKVKFKTPYKSILANQGEVAPQWFFGSKINIADSCFNTGKKEAAIVFKEEKGPLQKITYGELNAMSNRVANGLEKLGAKQGDAYAVDMVMTAEAIAIYLGIIKAGCSVVSIADSLAPEEINKRLKIANARGIFTQDVIIRGTRKYPLYQKVLKANPKMAIVIPMEDNFVGELREQDIFWDDFIDSSDKYLLKTCNPSDVVNVLFSSGTTGDPKAIPWDHTTPIKCAMDGYLHHDIKQRDVVCWPTNLGWMMGPWLIFASLMNKATIALYYGAPTTREFIEFVSEARVTMLGLVPSIVKQWRLENCLKDIKWDNLKNFSSTGESSNADDMFWLMAMAGYKPVIEYCGGTEIGGGYLTGSMVHPASPACFTTPAMGLDIVLMSETGATTQKGEVFIIPPSLGLSSKLLNKDHNEVYFEGCPQVTKKAKGCSGVLIVDQIQNGTEKATMRRHGDEIEKLNNGFYMAHGRVDDTMNLGGIKVSSVEIESVLNKQDSVRETAAIATNIAGGPSELVVFAVLKHSSQIQPEHLKPELQKLIKARLNPLFKIKEVLITDSLPRTASNKVMRRSLRAHYLEGAGKK